MDGSLIWILAIILLAFGVGVWASRDKIRGRPIPDMLKSGEPLPEFSAVTEEGETVSTAQLKGAPAVLLFVRGSWCPFCSKQVANLTDYYKSIVDAGAKLILITPKPLQTTRRVADFFEVDFDFWLDDSLIIARKLGLLLDEGVPGDARDEYGEDTYWPAAVVVDGAGTIRYTELSRFIADRPNPQTLLKVVQDLR